MDTAGTIILFLILTVIFVYCAWIGDALPMEPPQQTRARKRDIRAAWKEADDYGRTYRL